MQSPPPELSSGNPGSRPDSKPEIANPNDVNARHSRSEEVIPPPPLNFQRTSSATSSSLNTGLEPEVARMRLMEATPQADASFPEVSASSQKPVEEDEDRVIVDYRESLQRIRDALLHAQKHAPAYAIDKSSGSGEELPAAVPQSLDDYGGDGATVDASSMQENVSKQGQAPIDDPEVDTDVPTLLEQMNEACVQINQHEMLLSQAQKDHKRTLDDWSACVEAWRAQLTESGMRKCSAYAEAVDEMHSIHMQQHSAARNYTRAATRVEDARAEHERTEAQATSRSSRQLDLVSSEAVTTAVVQLQEATTERDRLDAVHSRKIADFAAARAAVEELKKKHGRLIERARPFLNMRREFMRKLRREKEVVAQEAQRLSRNKELYWKTMEALERISESIHSRRATRMAESATGSCEPPPTFDGLPPTDL